MKQVYTILFDLDGTLVDTAPDLMNAHNYVMKKFGFETRSTDEQSKAVVSEFIKAIESSEIWIDQSKHDELISLTSHLPHILSSALVSVAMKEQDLNEFINLGSSCMYPSNFREAIDENDLLSDNLEPTNEGYAIAKITTAKLCEYVTKQFSGKSYKTLLPCNLFGKYDKFDVHKSPVCYWFVGISRLWYHGAYCWY